MRSRYAGYRSRAHWAEARLPRRRSLVSPFQVPPRPPSPFSRAPRHLAMRSTTRTISPNDSALRAVTAQACLSSSRKRCNASIGMANVISVNIRHACYGPPRPRSGTRKSAAVGDSRASAR
jgi:hypothetical protein